MATSELDPPKKGRAISLTVVRTELRNLAKKQTVEDAGSTAEPKAPRNNFYTIRIPAEPTTFSFAKQSAISGLKFLTFSTLSFGAAAFLLFEMHHTPLLRLPIITVAVICVAIGLVLGHLSIVSFRQACVNGFVRVAIVADFTVILGRSSDEVEPVANLAGRLVSSGESFGRVATAAREGRTYS